MSYQDSIGRNAEVGDSLSAGLLLTEGCADSVGLSDRARVVGELARVQPRVARIAANKRTVDEHVAMLSILTPSPELESRETSSGGVREPSGHPRPYGPGALSSSEWGEGISVLQGLLPRHTFKTGLQGRTGIKSPARAIVSGSCGRFRRSWRRRKSETRGSRRWICNRPRQQSFLPQSPPPFPTRPRGPFRSRFTTSSEAVLCRWRSCESA